jgi:hypothetical protein
MHMQSPAANEALQLFSTNTRAILTNPTATTPKQVYASIGRAWVQLLRSVETLDGSEAHVPEDGRAVADDVKDAVQAAIGVLWMEIKPTLGGKALQQRTTSIESAFTEAYRGTLAHAADRAAAAAAPAAIQMTPDAPDVAPGYMTPREAPPAGGPDLVDMLMSRMPGAAPTSAAPIVPAPITGNGGGATAQRAAAVSPDLARAATRLTGIGCPPLRVDKLGPQLALHLLLSKDTFTAYVEPRGLTGGQLREALTLARALDLGTVEFGSAFLVSSPAEVMLRRLVSLMLGVKMGNFKMASFLEEVPGEGALDVLPDTVLKSIQERMKLVLKLEALTH